MTPNLEGLDHAFLRWLPVVAEDQKAFQRFYLPFFDDCDKVVDLGCGEGNFLELLEENGIAATGVDFDPRACAVVRERGLDVIQADALTYLADAEPESVDGVFAAHLVEHLPYEAVIELVRGVFRILRPGGVVVLATPNVRSLYSHLEMFYLHFGHVTFYHPRLITFFLKFEGFTDTDWGVNSTAPYPLCGDLRALLESRQEEPAPAVATPAELPPITYDPQLPRSTNPLRSLIWHAKMWFVRMVVQPYLDELVGQLNGCIEHINKQLVEANRALNQGFDRSHARLNAILAHDIAVLDRVDRPFEAWAVGRKPEDSAT